MAPWVAAGVLTILTVNALSRRGWLSLDFLFYVAMFFFQVMPLVANAYVLFPDRDYGVHADAIITALLGFFIGYQLVGAPKLEMGSAADPLVLGLIHSFGRFLIVLTFPVCTFIALRYITSSRALNYGYEPGMLLAEQVFMYSAVFGLQFVYASYDRASDRARFLLVVAVLLPRLIISLSYARFYFLQVLLPVLALEAIIWRSRYPVTPRWIPVTAVSLGAAFLMVPLYIRARGEQLFADIGQFAYGLFLGGSSLAIFDEFLRNRDLLPDISYSFGSLFYAVFPFLADGDYLVALYDRELINRLDRALTKLTVTDTAGAFMGTGGNFIVDLYADGGFALVFVGALLIAYTTRYFERRFLLTAFATFVSFHIISRIVYLPRGTFPEFFDRIAHSLMIWVAVVCLAQLTVIALRRNWNRDPGSHPSSAPITRATSP